MGSVVKQQAATRALCTFLGWVLWGIFIFWVVFWILKPTATWDHLSNSITQHAATTYFGRAGCFALIFSVPIFLIAIIGALYLEFSSKLIPTIKKRSLKFVRFNPWTYPLLVRGPLGIVTAAELMILGGLLALLAWTLTTFLTRDFSTLDPNKLPKGWTLWQKKLNKSGTRLGLLGLVPFSLLFFPVSRGSVILQLINIPFERAAKYHIWIANITLVIWSIHGLVFTILWGSRNELHLLWQWKKTGVNNVCGVITFIIGVIMGLTAMHPIRKSKFEIFYYTHHLYVFFVFGFMLHVGDVVFSTILGGLFLFFVDRFLRLVQSRHKMTTMSAQFLHANMVEVKFPKSPCLSYNTLSAIFLNFPKLSTLQWHPFTITSSSKMNMRHISILVKCQGTWTSHLKGAIEEGTTNSQLSTQFIAAIEGPYGQKFNFFQKYESIIFVAGGSGISPFLGLLQELVYYHQMKDAASTCLTSEVVLIWAVKTSEELHNISQLCPSLTNSDYRKTLSLDIRVFVTREKPDMESNHLDTVRQIVKMNTRSNYPDETGKVMDQNCAVLPGRSNGFEHAAIILASILGYCLVQGIVGHFVIYPIDQNSNKIYPVWAKCLFIVLSMLIGITGFGGVTLLLIEFLRKPKQFDQEETHAADSKQPAVYESMDILQENKICYGHRPDLDELFSEHETGRAAKDFGVLVCGPQSMLQSVALQCKAHTSLTSGSSNTFHFHPLTFEL